MDENMLERQLLDRVKHLEEQVYYLELEVRDLAKINKLVEKEDIENQSQQNVSGKMQQNRSNQLEQSDQNRSNMPFNGLQNTPPNMPYNGPQHMPPNMPYNGPQHMPPNISYNGPQHMPPNMPYNGPQHMPPNMSYNGPQGLPIHRNQLPMRPRERRFNEALVGKYFIGVLSAILVFIAAMSLVSLLWTSLTPGMKLGLILGSGLLLSGIGFRSIQQKKSPVTAIAFGTGVGLTYIGILSAYIFFDLIDSTTAILLASVWSVLLIMSYRYTQVFFTTIIAFIGSYMTLFLALSLIKNIEEFIVLTIFVLGVSTVLLVTSIKWLDCKKQLASISMILLNFVTLLFGASSIGELYGHRAIVLILIAIVYVMLNYLYIIMDSEEDSIWYQVVNVVVSGVTVFALASFFGEEVMEEYERLATALCFFLLNTAQILFLEFRIKKIRKANVIYYSCLQLLPVMILQFELFEIALGLFLIYGILIVLQKIGNHNDYTAIISAFILLDVFFLVMAIGSHSGSEEVTIVYGLLQVLIISYVLYDNYKNQITEYFMFTKITGFITYAITSLFLPYYITYQLLPKADLLTDIEGYSSNNYTSFFVAFVCVSIFIFVIAASGYMTDWGDYEFQWFRKTDLLQDGTSVVFYIVTLSSMQLGLRLINSHHMDSVIEGLLLVLGILGIALLQSANLIKYYRQRSFVGVWMGFKYLILTWLILNALTNVGIASVLLSLSGLVVAILCIALGFHLEIKSLRLYGLILTIVMVVKFILVDLYQENSITRVISLLLGGIICLGITALYNMLNGELEKN